MTVCPVPGCPVLTDGGRCDQHRVTRSGTKGYGDQRWRETSHRLLDSAPGCQCTLDHCSHDGPCKRTPRYTDHIVERRDGGSDDPSNLQALCPPCHGLKTWREKRRRKR